uniref:hypothetical protein n=1 Tax=Fluviicola sp. TaxID=1917219 RepID=UPI002635BE8B
MFLLVKNKALFLLAVTTLVSSSGWSQSEIIIKGKVVNEMGAPVKNASVKIDIHNTRTNNNGVFIL